MNTRTAALALSMALAVSSAPILGQSAATTLALQTVHSLWAQPINVQVEQHDDATVVSGRLRKSAANRSRILYGEVWAEVLDATGTVLAVHTAKPHRVSPAKHSRLAKFAISIDQLPDSATALRIGYR